MDVDKRLTMKQILKIPLIERRIRKFLTPEEYLLEFPDDLLKEERFKPIEFQN